jgi:thiol-disulfide isomerase/thioredoxin
MTVTTPVPALSDPHRPARRRVLKGAVGVAAAGAFLPLIGAGAAAADYPPTDGEMQGFVLLKDPAPPADTAFFDGAGNERRFADFRGEVLLVNFWATWCAPCIKEMPSLARLSDRLSGEPFRLLAISQDRAGQEVAEPFIREKLGLTEMEIYYDPRLQLGRAMGNKGLPTTYVVDAAGNLIGALTGPAEWDSDDAVALLRHVIAGST